MRIFILLIAMLVLCPGVATAAADAAAAPSADAVLQSALEHAPSATPPAPAADPNAPTPEQTFRMLQEQDKHMEIFALIGSMIFALLLMLAAVRLCGHKAYAGVVSGGGLVLIIFGTLFIAVYASTPDQLTAPIGILGAIAGYLFGSAQRAKDSDQSESPRDVAPYDTGSRQTTGNVVVPLQPGAAS
jgi:hypothetical protein